MRRARSSPRAPSSPPERSAWESPAWAEPARSVRAGGGATPIGRICASAGLSANPPSAANNSKEFERRFIGLTNLFISNDNPSI
jgi:hypothetical protein